MKYAIQVCKLNIFHIIVLFIQLEPVEVLEMTSSTLDLFDTHRVQFSYSGALASFHNYFYSAVAVSHTDYSPF
jgi:hypothetical protein